MRYSFLLIFFLFSGCFWPKSSFCTVSLDKMTYNLEIARTPEEQERGLMYRDSLCPECGMIFVYSDERHRSFWMKNTPLSLDIYFFDSQGKLVDKTLKMEPFSRTVYTSLPAQYVVEISAGSEPVDHLSSDCLYQ